MMAAYNRSTSAKGYVGIPALIFIEFTHYGRGTQTYEEKRVILHKIYAYMRGYLPVSYNKDDKIIVYNDEIAPLLKEVSEEIRKAREAYKSTFENKSCDPDEKIFQTIMDGIFERLVEISGVSKVIDKEKMETEEVIF
jgi:predicted AlkP superfamily phosphohydrolase/phosphomutase